MVSNLFIIYRRQKKPSEFTYREPRPLRAQNRVFQADRPLRRNLTPKARKGIFKVLLF